MKKRLLRFGSFVMALVVLFVSVGWDVCFHYCTSSHTMSSHLGTSAAMHAQCYDIVPCIDENAVNHSITTHFDTRGCCNDFDSRIQFTDSFTFSADKHLSLHFQPFTVLPFDVRQLLPEVKQAVGGIRLWKIPHLPIGKTRLFLLSNLRLNPLVF